MPQLLLIGLDAADWTLLSEKIAQGKLPHLATLIKTGSSGPLRSLHPLFSPALWATIATGKRPYDHGITGFTLPDDSGSGLQPYSSSSLQSPSFWHILSHEKKRSHVVGWWNTAPAEAIRGVIVDETFRIAERPSTEPWTTRSKSVSPSTFLKPLSQKRVHPQNLAESLLRRLVPKLYEINPHEDPRLSAIAKILAEDLTTLEVTFQLLREPDWDMTTLCLMGVDSLCHHGMNLRAPLSSNNTHLAAENPEAAFQQKSHELYGTLVDNAYELYDEWIGKLVGAVGKETTIMIVSDHGFFHDHRRPRHLGIEATAPCAHHSPIGTIILHGPSVKQGATLTHATILDICPTVLSFFGIPVGRDMPGKPLTAAFQNPIEKKRILSWNFLERKKSGDDPPEASAEATQRALKQLVALGYLPTFPSTNSRTLQEAHCDQFLHTALAYLNDEQLDRALTLLEKARRHAQQFNLIRPDILKELALLYWQLGKNRAAAANFRQLIRLYRRNARQAAEELASKAAQITPTTPLSFSECWEIKNLLSRALLDGEQVAFIFALAEFLSDKNESALTTLITLAEKNPHDSFLNFYAAKCALAHKADYSGLCLLERVANDRPEEASALALFAEHQNKIGLFVDAEKKATSALERNPLHTASWLALATSYAHQQRWQEARSAALQARTSLLHREALFDLLALIASQEKDVNPRRAARYKGLARSAATKLEALTTNTSPLSHQKNFSFAQKKSSTPLSKKELLVVTGIPRSGTSLMMQMLAAGGAPIMTDDLRMPDEHNPRGYFEHEKIKYLANDFSFLQRGTAVKIVIPLLWELPATLPIRLIFIQRSLSEVITSQHRMAGKIASREELEKVYYDYETKTLAFVKQCSWPLLRLSHAAVLAAPQNAALEINQFLGGSLSVTAMARVIDPALHRAKS